MTSPGGLDSILTLSQRQVGIMQPRPLSTLHVGGQITADGALNAASLAVTGAVSAGSLAVAGNVTVGGTLGVTGATTLGVLNAGVTRVTRLNAGTNAAAVLDGDIASSRNSAPTTGTYYFGTSSGVYLFYDGASFSLAGGPLSATLAAGTAQALIAQYSARANWTAPATYSTWFETSAQCTGTSRGGCLVRIEATGLAWEGQGNAFVDLGLMLDGVLIGGGNLCHFQSAAAGLPSGVQFCMIHYLDPGAGSHRYSIALYSGWTSPGTGGLYLQVPTQIWVTEQRI